jgi:hypothetical protein
MLGMVRYGFIDSIIRQHQYLTTLSDIGGNVMIENEDNEDNAPAAEIISAKCTKCKSLLDHVAVARDDEGVILKVRCLTCGSEHKYRPEVKKPVKKAVRAKKIDPARDFELLTEKFKGKKPQRYSMSGSFRPEDVIDHSVFGMGIVISAFNKQMEVVFSDRPRILVFNRQELETSR